MDCFDCKVSRRGIVETSLAAGSGAAGLHSPGWRPLRLLLTALRTAAAVATAAATGTHPVAVESSFEFTSFHLKSGAERRGNIMHIAIIALHLFLICAAVILLSLICSTGNFWNYPGAGIWIALDLMVSIAGVAFYGHPEYAHLIPRLAVFHLTAMAICLAWMGIDCWRDAHVLSGVIFWAFFAYGAARVGELMAYKWHFASPLTLEACNAVAYLMVVGLLIAAMLLPAPPETVTDQPAWRGNALIMTPVPPVMAASEVRQ